jgi:hypothetical protein
MSRFSFLACSVLRYTPFVICYYLLLTYTHRMFLATEDAPMA